MSDSDGYLDEVRRMSAMDERDIERLFAGDVPASDPQLGEIACFLGDLGEAFPEASTEPLESAHLHAMTETARLLAEKGEPAARPASNAYGPAEQASGLPGWRRSTMFKRVLTKRWVQVVAAAMALVVAFGGAAYAGILPAPVQKAVATAADQVGVALPTPQPPAVQSTVETETPDIEAPASAESTEPAEIDSHDTSAAAPAVKPEEDNQGEDTNAVEQDHQGEDSHSTSVEQDTENHQQPAQGVQQDDHESAPSQPAPQPQSTSTGGGKSDD